jgi:hypothetical protein
MGCRFLLDALPLYVVIHRWVAALHCGVLLLAFTLELSTPSLSLPRRVS